MQLSQLPCSFTARPLQYTIGSVREQQLLLQASPSDSMLPRTSIRPFKQKRPGYTGALCLELSVQLHHRALSSPYWPGRSPKVT
jgi:hypothetical protein